MRFIGNKENLIPKIYEILCKHRILDSIIQNSHNIYRQNNQINTLNKPPLFFDVFAGTTSVGKFFKQQGFQIYSCDLLYFSYCLQKAYLENNQIPNFHHLAEIISQDSHNILFASPYQKVLEYLNNLENTQDFIYHNYAPSGSKDLEIPRKYFSDYNAQKIDSIRLKIEEWKVQNKLSENEYFILLATLIESLSFFSNVAGVYAAFCKDWDRRALKPLQLREIEILQSDREHFCFCGDSVEVLTQYKNKNFDIFYLDPPYNHRQYAPNYHLIETIARYDNPRISGVAGLREWKQQKSKFCNAKSAIIELEKIAQMKNYKYLILSYNNEGLMRKDEINELLKCYGNVICEEIIYPRFKSNAKRSKKYINEYVWIVQR
ncbi:adenine methyltransferase [Helicobacter didelphidarum]|uniref:Adenine methyltransferase n=1 Tax=Helicobacter didelphidarum TaxID=2040648 RepID=A0A3D8IJW3_9HELI|nr:DNA adenine methylase [Helicobacter didelphidarum]RDU64954.1 adenine methyltransferase [Helicobacter didelphidarum]